MKQVIRKPVLTEKSLQLASRGLYTFAVAADSTKVQIGKAIETVYNVSVISVRTVRMHGKVRRTGKRMTLKTLQDWKKAVVALKQGQTIDAFHITGEQKES